MSHVYIKSHPGASHLKTLRCVLAYEIIYKTKGIFSASGGSRVT